MARYDYKSPRRVNWVSILVILVLLGGAYAGWKFAPQYWQSYKVDEILSEYKNVAAELSDLNPAYRPEREQKIVNDLYLRVQALGITDTPDQPLEVGFGPNYSHLYVKYQKVVSHPFGKKTRMNFHRKANIPRSRGL